MQIILSDSEEKELEIVAKYHDIPTHNLMDRYTEMVEANFSIDIEDAVDASI